MPSPLILAQQELASLEAQTESLLAEGSTATTEQIEAHTLAVTSARKKVSAIQAAMEIQRTAAPVTSTASNSIEVNPRSAQDPKRGFRSLGEFAIAAKNFQGARSGRFMGRVDPRIQVVASETERFLAQEKAELAQFGYSSAAPGNLHQEGHSEDGLNVPPDFRNEIWKPALQVDDLVSLFPPQTTSSAVVEFAADETTPWGAAGIHAYWPGEGKQIPSSKLATQPRQCRLHKLAVLAFQTNEIEMDAPLLTSRLETLAPMAIGWELGEALYRGTGAGKPLGWENSSAIVTQAKESGQAATTLTAGNVASMAARVIAGPGANLVWLLNRDVIPALVTLRVGNEPSWIGRDKGLQDAPNGLLLSDPLFFTEHANTLGAVGDVTLVNTNGYVFFIHSSGTRYDSSLHLYFDYDISAYRWVVRVGGMPYLENPVSPAKGSNTRSYFVNLQAR